MGLFLSTVCDLSSASCLTAQFIMWPTVPCIVCAAWDVLICAMKQIYCACMGKARYMLNNNNPKYCPFFAPEMSVIKSQCSVTVVGVVLVLHTVSGARVALVNTSKAHRRRCGTTKHESVFLEQPYAYYLHLLKQHCVNNNVQPYNITVYTCSLLSCIWFEMGS